MFTAVAPSVFFVLSGPCGTGKTSLAHAWQREQPDLGYVRSVTTRAPRDGARVEEQHYDYVSCTEFLRMIDERIFAQWIRPSYGEYYGTRQQPLQDAISGHTDLVFDYCPEGYLNLKRQYPENVVGIFVMAPDVDTMRRRLAARGTENQAEMELRFEMARRDFNFVDQHEYHLVNDDFTASLLTLQAIRSAEKARLKRQPSVLDAYARHAAPALLRYYESPSDGGAVGT